MKNAGSNSPFNGKPINSILKNLWDLNPKAEIIEDREFDAALSGIGWGLAVNGKRPALAVYSQAEVIGIIRARATSTGGMHGILDKDAIRVADKMFEDRGPNMPMMSIDYRPAATAAKKRRAELEAKWAAARRKGQNGGDRMIKPTEITMHALASSDFAGLSEECDHFVRKWGQHAKLQISDEIPGPGQSHLLLLHVTHGDSVDAAVLVPHYDQGTTAECTYSMHFDDEPEFYARVSQHNIERVPLIIRGKTDLIMRALDAHWKDMLEGDEIRRALSPQPAIPNPEHLATFAAFHAKGKKLKAAAPKKAKSLEGPRGNLVIGLRSGHVVVAHCPENMRANAMRVLSDQRTVKRLIDEVPPGDETILGPDCIRFNVVGYEEPAKAAALPQLELAL